MEIKSMRSQYVPFKMSSSIRFVSVLTQDGRLEAIEFIAPIFNPFRINNTVDAILQQSNNNLRGLWGMSWPIFIFLQSTGSAVTDQARSMAPSTSWCFAAMEGDSRAEHCLAAHRHVILSKARTFSSGGGTERERWWWWWWGGFVCREDRSTLDHVYDRCSLPVKAAETFHAHDKCSEHFPRLLQWGVDDVRRLRGISDDAGRGWFVDGIHWLAVSCLLGDPAHEIA